MKRLTMKETQPPFSFTFRKSELKTQLGSIWFLSNMHLRFEKFNIRKFPMIDLIEICSKTNLQIAN